MAPGIVEYYEQRNGNPDGLPIVHIGINLQAGQDAQTDNFIRQAGFKIVANDVNRALASRFQSSGQPIFVVINGVANSPSHKQWEVLVNQNGYGTTQHPIETFRAAINQVRAPAALPPPEPPSAPSITVQPQSQTVIVGASVTFTSTASGTPPLHYQWQWNGVDLPGAGSSQLLLTNVQPAQAGNYSVTVTNAAGSATSLAAVLAVIVPVTIATQPQTQTVLAGATVTFTASATGTPPFAFQWRKNGEPIAGATNALLALESVTVSQSGEYSVQISNAATSVLSDIAILTIESPAQPPARLSLNEFRRLADGTVEFTLKGEAGRGYRIEVSSNLVDWTVLGSVTTTNATQAMRDGTAINIPQRFYRAVTP